MSLYVREGPKVMYFRLRHWRRWLSLIRAKRRFHDKFTFGVTR